MMNFEDAKELRVCSRRIYAAPSSGSAVRSRLRHSKVIESVFNKNED